MNQQIRMILVEGIPFTGKSTTSEYIATQLNLNGAAAHWVSEGMLLQRYFPHAVEVFDQQQPLAEAVMRTEWSSFVEAALASDSIFVVDSALSYAAVAPLMTEDRPVAAIQAELRHIAAVCAPLQPHVIHLTGDVERLVPASIVERGAGWQEHLVRQAESAPYQQARGRSGVAGAISMLGDSQEILRAVLAHDPWPTLTLDITDPDWATHRRAILAFLQLDEVLVDRPAIAPSVLQSYIGTYVADDQERAEKVLSVQLEHETLVLHIADTRYGPLLPISPTRFHLQATPVDIEFAIEAGLAQYLTILRSDGTAQRFRRT